MLGKGSHNLNSTWLPDGKMSRSSLPTQTHVCFALLLLFTMMQFAPGYYVERPSLSSSSRLRYDSMGYSLYSRAYGNFKCRRNTLKLRVVEHAVDCSLNPVVAQLYGVNSEQCFNTGNHFMSNLGGALNEAFTIGFFIVATIVVNRSKHKIGTFSLDDYDDEGNFVAEQQSYRHRREDDTEGVDDIISGTTCRCRICAGSGIIGIGSGSAKQCPICNGTGETLTSNSVNNIDKGGFRNMDRSISNRQLPPSRSDDSDEY